VLPGTCSDGVLTIIFFTLAALVALGNIVGVVGAMRRQRRGDDRGFSCVPFLSILFCVGAWLAGPEPLGLWVIVPAAVDPSTWSLILGAVHNPTRK